MHMVHTKKGGGCLTYEDVLTVPPGFRRCHTAMTVREKCLKTNTIILLEGTFFFFCKLLNTNISLKSKNALQIHDRL